MALFGPVFKTGETVNWADPTNCISLLVGEGPFTVVSVWNNPNPRACACGALDTSLEHIPSEEHPCGDVPAQFVTIRNMKGELIGEGDHKPPRYRSAYFKKA